MNESLFNELIEYINDNQLNEKVIDYVSKANRQELEYLLQEGD